MRENDFVKQTWLSLNCVELPTGFSEIYNFGKQVSAEFKSKGK